MRFLMVARLEDYAISRNHQGFRTFEPPYSQSGDDTITLDTSQKIMYSQKPSEQSNFYVTNYEQYKPSEATAGQPFL